MAVICSHLSRRGFARHQQRDTATDPHVWDVITLGVPACSCKFQQLVEQGRSKEALQLARRDLAPLTEAHPGLLIRFKVRSTAYLTQKVLQPDCRVPALTTQQVHSAWGCRPV